MRIFKHSLEIAVATFAWGLTASAQVPEVENPFSEGTGPVVIEAEVQMTIQEYAQSSRNQLEQVLRDTARLTASDAVPQLMSAVRAVVLRSHRVSRGRELLSRIILNQALELTSGRPNASGTGTERPGVLANHPGAPIELTYRILRDSITLARQYTERDADLVMGRGEEPQGLLNLPYDEAAQARLSLARQWDRSVTLAGARVEYAFLRVAFMQWLNIVARSENVRAAQLAQQIARVQSILEQFGNIENSSTGPIGPIAQGMRRMRGLLLEITGGSTPVSRPRTIEGASPQAPISHTNIQIGDRFGCPMINRHYHDCTVERVLGNGSYVMRMTMTDLRMTLSWDLLTRGSGCTADNSICVGERRQFVGTEVFRLTAEGIEQRADDERLARGQLASSSVLVNGISLGRDEMIRLSLNNGSWFVYVRKQDLR